MSTRRLVLHIGLPKTATTFLQHYIMKPAVGHRFIHRKRGDRARRICRSFREYAAADDPTWICHREQIRAKLIANDKKSANDRTIIVSDENISGRGIQFWHGRGPGPKQLSERLAALAQSLGDCFPTLRVVIGIRRQDQWLASRYAECSTGFDNFSQSDFGPRIVEITRLDPLGPVFDWLDYYKVYSLFSQALGADNVFMYSVERLRAEPENTLKDLGEFVGECNFTKVYETLIKDGVNVIRNKLSSGDNTWSLRRDGATLRLSQELQEVILTRLSESNKALNRLVPIHFF